MKLQRQWIKLHQRLLDHPWLHDDNNWIAAWIQMLLSAKDDGTVDLTSVPARSGFTEKRWRVFLSKLEAEGMIADRRTVNLGKRKGRRIVARLASWNDYQSLKNPVDDENIQGRSTVRSKGRSTGRSAPSSTTPETSGTGGAPDGVKGGVRAEPIFLRELETPPTPPRANDKPQEASRKTTETDHPWSARQQFAATPVGGNLITYLGPLARRTNLEELQRIASLWTPAEIDAAWVQAKRDARGNTNKTLLLILQGEIALDKKLLPETTFERTNEGPQPGQVVKLPDGSEHEVFAYDEVGNFVYLADREPVRPSDCIIIERVSN